MDSSSDDPHSSQGLPFLILHWLANFEGSRGISPDEEERRRAVERIRAATVEIASAFSTLGAFGITIPVRHESR
jgi:hypothetical protein